MTDKIELTHVLNPLPADADGELARKICSALSGRIYGQPGLVGAWRVSSRQKADPAGLFADVLGLKDKAAYLAFRDLLKAHLRFFAEDQKRLAIAMRRPGGNPEAQCRHAQHADLVTTLIEIRRAGKTWSAAQAAAGRAAAA
ncbi:hypothetical protein [Paracoccus sp. ME4]|uniref:hypothetical protein n=1 Tax=Paracoccus sp. ME4 TaxID=3138066 RepID=UPI00398AE721